MIQNDLIVFERYIRFLDSVTEELFHSLTHMKQRTDAYYSEWKDEVYKKVAENFSNIEAILKKMVLEIHDKNDKLKHMKLQFDKYLGGV